MLGVTVFLPTAAKLQTTFKSKTMTRLIPRFCFVGIIESELYSISADALGLVPRPDLRLDTICKSMPQKSALTSLFRYVLANVVVTFIIYGLTQTNNKKYSKYNICNF